MAMGTNGVDSPASQPVAADGRMAELEALFLGGPLMAGNMHGAKSLYIIMYIVQLFVPLTLCRLYYVNDIFLEHRESLINGFHLNGYH